MIKKALIVGCTGQDGTYLFKNLQRRNYEIIGIARDFVHSTIQKHIKPVDISNTKQVCDLLDEHKPDEIYYLAVFHQSAEEGSRDDTESFRNSIDVNLLSLNNFLEGINKYSRNSRLFYAASSHIFGDTSETIQCETSHFKPNCVYGITKTAGIHASHFYRKAHSVFSSVGILYNHSSPIQSSRFVCKKIVDTAVSIKNKAQDKLIVGNLGQKIDLGYAPDYVEAMYRILQLSSPEDFIISSGKVHTVLDIVKSVFEYLDMDWTKFVEENPDLIAKKGKPALLGNNQKLKLMTGWQPTVSFNEMIKIMVTEGRK